MLTVIGLAGLEGGEYGASCEDCCLYNRGETDRCDVWVPCAITGEVGPEPPASVRKAELNVCVENSAVALLEGDRVGLCGGGGDGERGGLVLL